MHSSIARENIELLKKQNNSKYEELMTEGLIENFLNMATKTDIEVENKKKQLMNLNLILIGYIIIQAINTIIFNNNYALLLNLIGPIALVFCSITFLKSNRKLKLLKNVYAMYLEQLSKWISEDGFVKNDIDAISSIAEKNKDIIEEIVKTLEQDETNLNEEQRTNLQLKKLKYIHTLKNNLHTLMPLQKKCVNIKRKMAIVKIIKPINEICFILFMIGFLMTNSFGTTRINLFLCIITLITSLIRYFIYDISDKYNRTYLETINELSIMTKSII